MGGAALAAFLSPAIGHSACGGGKVFAGLLPFVAAVLAAAAWALLMRPSPLRFYTACCVATLVLLADLLIFGFTSLDSHYCGP